MKLKLLIILALSFFVSALCVTAQDTESKDKKMETEEKKLETATVGGGCFWCIEAVYERIKGVDSADSGYAGGEVKNPTYKQVCEGTTGHAEVVQVHFDPEVISYEQVLSVFFEAHDPTTLNRQGADRGTQYRSIILYHNDEQKAVAEKVIKKLTDDKKFQDPIVTEVKKLDVYYLAEEDHQDFYTNNTSNGYCRAVITPKLIKLGLETK